MKVNPVNPRYLPVTWANDISVEQNGNVLLIFGRLPVLEDTQPERDMFRYYEASLKTRFAQKGSNPPTPPHFVFANAANDEELINFVRAFGPVNARWVEDVESDDPDDPRVFRRAEQDLDDLRAEQRIFAAAMGVVSELARPGAKCDLNVIDARIQAIVHGVADWPLQAEREAQSRQRTGTAHLQTWNFSKRNLEHLEFYSRNCLPVRFPTAYAGHQVVCGLINSLRSEVLYTDTHAVELSSEESIHFGVRPVLYSLLKRVYLSRGGLDMCANDRCSRFFVISRAGQRYCAADCSLQHRQGNYYRRKGKRHRVRRKRKT